MKDEPKWPFDQAPDVAAITTRQVLEDGLPILIVTHYEDDHSWAFVCGTTSETSDGRVIDMDTALAIDPTIAELAHLAPGFSAYRNDINQPWNIRKSEP